MNFIHIEDFCNILSKKWNQISVDILQVGWSPELVNLLLLSFECKELNLGATYISGIKIL